MPEVSEDFIELKENEILKRHVKELISKRELSVVDNLVRKYRDGGLTEIIALSSIAAIAEMRSIVDNIRTS